MLWFADDRKEQAYSPAQPSGMDRKMNCNEIGCKPEGCLNVNNQRSLLPSIGNIGMLLTSSIGDIDVIPLVERCIHETNQIHISKASDYVFDTSVNEVRRT